MRRLLKLSALVAALVSGLGCATAGPPRTAQDRYSPDQMRRGPRLTETGRLAATPVSSGGLQIQDARPDGAPIVAAAVPPSGGPRHRLRRPARAGR